MLKRITGNIVAVSFWAGLVVAVVVLWLTGVLGDAWTGLREAKPLPLFLVVVAGIALPLVHAWRWQIVMRSLETSLTFGRAADITVSSALLNYASPGFVGASAKAVLANQTRSVPYRASALSIGFEHTLDLGMMAGTSLIAVLIIGPSVFREAASPLEELASFAVIAITTVIVIIGVVVAWKFGAWKQVKSMFSAAGRLGRQVNRSAVAGLTGLYWLLQVVVVALLFWAFSIPVVAVDVLAISTVPVLAGMLAPVPGGVGVREAVIVALTAVTGATVGTLVTLAIIQRVLLVASLPLALALLRIARRIDVRFA